MKTWMKIVLAVIVLAAIAFFMLRLQKDQGEDTTTPEKPVVESVLPVISPDEITGVQVVGLQTEYSLSRVSSSFLLSGEMEIENVDQETVQRQLNAIAALSPLEVLSEELSDDDVGLGGYEILSVSLRDGSQHEIRIGDRALTNNTRAVKRFVNGEQIGPRLRISGDDYDAVMPMRKDLLKN